MNTQRVIVRDGRYKDTACTRINALPDEGDYEILICDFVKKRSLAQQALMWIWHKQWAQHFGDEVDAEHIRFKAKYLLPILLRDDVVDGIADVYIDAQGRAMEGDRGALNALYRMISTTWLKVRQMHEILAEYEREAAHRGLAFITLCPEYEDAFPKRLQKGITIEGELA